jgi:hypothetical protein
MVYAIIITIVLIILLIYGTNLLHDLINYVNDQNIYFKDFILILLYLIMLILCILLYFLLFYIKIL